MLVSGLRSRQKYSLNECLFIVSKLHEVDSLYELEELTQRTLSGLKQKSFRVVSKEKTIQEIKLLDISSMKDLYSMFEVSYPDNPREVEEDIKNRIKNFEMTVVKKFV